MPIEDKILIWSFSVSFVFHILIAMPYGVISEIFDTSTPEEQYMELVYKEYLKTEAAMEMPEEMLEPEPEPEPEMAPPEPEPEKESVDVVEEQPPEPEPEAVPEPAPAPEPEDAPAEEIQKQKEELQKKVDEIKAEDLTRMIVTYSDVLREFINVNFQISKKERVQILQELGTDEASVHVYFILHADGSLEDVFIPNVYKSRSEKFNNLAEESIRKAAKRFPTFPKSYNKETETFEIVISISAK